MTFTLIMVGDQRIQIQNDLIISLFHGFAYDSASVFGLIFLLMTFVNSLVQKGSGVMFFAVSKADRNLGPSRLQRGS